MSNPANAAATGPNPQVYIDGLLQGLAGQPNGIVLRHRGQDVTAVQFLASVYRHARALAGVGIGRGKLVALFAPNCPQAVAIRYASHVLGAATVYLSAPASAQRRAELVEQMVPDLLVVFPETARLLPPHVACPVASVGGALPAPAPQLDRLAAAQAPEPMDVRARPQDLGVVVCSGGTTGVPKGSWRTFASYSAMVLSPSAPGRRQLVNGPLAYLSQVLVDTTLLGGGCVIFRDAYDAADTLATVEHERVTDLFLVEPQLFELMDHPDLPHRDHSSLRAITHIGASAAPTLRLRARERLGAVLAHSYGASEMGLVSILTPAEHDLSRPQRFTCAGRIREGVEIRFRRVEDNALAAPAEPGSIEVRSPAVAGGYRHRPELQAQAFKDGWYRSGDLGRVDDEGCLHILGRVADIRWIDGRMVSPTLVQDTLCHLAQVRYCVVVVDAEAGHWVAAVVPWPGMPFDERVCRGAVAAEFGDAFAGAIVFVAMARVPLTEQGKPDRIALEAMGRGQSG